MSPGKYPPAQAPPLTSFSFLSHLCFFSFLVVVREVAQQPASKALLRLGLAHLIRTLARPPLLDRSLSFPRAAAQERLHPLDPLSLVPHRAPCARSPRPLSSIFPFPSGAPPPRPSFSLARDPVASSLHRRQPSPSPERSRAAAPRARRHCLPLLPRSALAGGESQARAPTSSSPVAPSPTPSPPPLPSSSATARFSAAASSSSGTRARARPHLACDFSVPDHLCLRLPSPSPSSSPAWSSPLHPLPRAGG